MDFLKFNNKVTRTTSLVSFCCLHWKPRPCFTNCLFLTLKTLLNMTPKTLKPMAFIVIVTFFEISNGNKKKLWCQEKWESSASKMVYAEDTFLWWGSCTSSFRVRANVIEKQSGTCRKYLLLPGLCVSSFEITTYLCNRFNTSFCTKNHKIHQAIFCFTLQHQGSRGEGKYGLRKRRNILVSDCDLQRFFFYYTTLILIYDMLSTLGSH